MSNFENVWICNGGERAIFVRGFKIFSLLYSDNEIEIVLTSISSKLARKNLNRHMRKGLLKDEYKKNIG